VKTVSAGSAALKASQVNLLSVLPDRRVQKARVASQALAGSAVRGVSPVNKAPKAKKANLVRRANAERKGNPVSLVPKANQVHRANVAKKAKVSRVQLGLPVVPEGMHRRLTSRLQWICRGPIHVEPMPGTTAELFGPSGTR
jgi:hypothetical protein